MALCRACPWYRLLPTLGSLQVSPSLPKCYSPLTHSFSVFFTTFINPIAMEDISWRWLIFYCCWLGFEVCFVYFMFPETFGRTLEELAFSESATSSDRTHTNEMQSLKTKLRLIALLPPSRRLVPASTTMTTASSRRIPFTRASIGVCRVQISRRALRQLYSTVYRGNCFRCLVAQGDGGGQNSLSLSHAILNTKPPSIAGISIIQIQARRHTGDGGRFGAHRHMLTLRLRFREDYGGWQS